MCFIVCFVVMVTPHTDKKCGFFFVFFFFFFFFFKFNVIADLLVADLKEQFDCFIARFTVIMKTVCDCTI